MYDNHPTETSGEEKFVLQFKILSVDGIKAQLIQERGFRNLVMKTCSGIGLSGFVWRVPRIDAQILALGIKIQFDRLIRFLNTLIENEFIGNYAVEKNRQDFYISSDKFSIMPSSRAGVITG